MSEANGISKRTSITWKILYLDNERPDYEG